MSDVCVLYFWLFKVPLLFIQRGQRSIDLQLRGAQHLQFTLAFTLSLLLDHTRYRWTDTNAPFKCIASFCVDKNLIDFVSLEQSASAVLNAVALLSLLSSLCQRVSLQTLSYWSNVWRSDVVEHLCLGLNLFSNRDVDLSKSTLPWKQVIIIICEVVVLIFTQCPWAKSSILTGVVHIAEHAL